MRSTNRYCDGENGLLDALLCQRLAILHRSIISLPNFSQYSVNPSLQPTYGHENLVHNNETEYSQTENNNKKGEKH